MFSSSLLTSLIALVVSAAAVSAAPSLTVTALIPDVDVDGLANLKVTTTVVNTGNETVKLLNDPRGVLDNFPEHSFYIANATGFSPSFIGGMVKYSPIYAASIDDPSAFTILAAGASINITHDLSEAYNFTQTGTGEYTVKPSRLFTYVDPDGNPNDFNATVGVVPTFKLSGNLVASPALDKRAKFDGCSSNRQNQVNAAASSAQVYASNAYSYLQRIGDRRTARYTTWFGIPYADDRDTVQRHFRLISTGRFSSFTYTCTCTKSTWYAYVSASHYGRINLCPLFWTSPNTGTDSRAGTLIHESSHFNINGATGDFAYGQAAAKRLAIINQSKAVENAENHQYFAENNPYLS